MENTSNLSFSILTYNILADSYSYKLVDADPQHLTFAYRTPLLLEQVKSLSSDIICFQEVDNYQDFYKDKIEELGYHVIYAQRTSDYPDGLILGAKKDKFEVINHEVLKFDHGHAYADNPTFHRGNVAIIAKLKHKASGKVVYVINTHLYWDPRIEYVRYLQMCQIISHVNTHLSEDDPLIWVGDFNSSPRSNVIRCILNDKAPDLEHSAAGNPDNVKIMQNMYEDISHIERKVKWASAYDSYKILAKDSKDNKDTIQGDLQYTSYTKPFKALIDHILYSEKNLVTKSLLKVPTPDEIGTVTLPNAKIPSDHLPLMAVFEFARK